MQQNLSSLSDIILVSTLKSFRETENRLVADIVSYLAEVDKRQIYRNLGFSSLFAFCTQALGYSEGAAQRRIIAARCLKANLEVYQLLKEGKVSLCVLSEVAKVITPENKTELLTLSQGLPKQEAQKLAAQYLPTAPAKRETVRAKTVVVAVNAVKPAVADGAADVQTAKPAAATSTESTATVAVEQRYSLSVEVDAGCMQLINDAKRYSGKTKLSELLKVVMKEYVSRKKPKQKAAAKAAKTEGKLESVRLCEKTSVSRVLKPSRYIPRTVKHQVRLRDQERCTYVAEDGRRCSETVGLQFDHCEPFAFGGKNVVDNLRLLCPAHNRLYGEGVFGRKALEQKATWVADRS